MPENSSPQIPWSSLDVSHYCEVWRQRANQDFPTRERQRQTPVTHRTRTVARMERRRIEESFEVSGTGADASVTKKRIVCSCNGTKRDVAHISPRARRLPRVDQGQGEQDDRDQTKERREPLPNGSSWQLGKVSWRQGFKRQRFH